MLFCAGFLALTTTTGHRSQAFLFSESCHVPSTSSYVFLSVLGNLTGGLVTGTHHWHGGYRGLGSTTQLTSRGTLVVFLDPTFRRYLPSLRLPSKYPFNSLETCLVCSLHHLTYQHVHLFLFLTRNDFKNSSYSSLSSR